MKKDVPAILLQLKELNQEYKVKLRYRKPHRNSPYLLYVDYHLNGKRVTESL